MVFSGRYSWSVVVFHGNFFRELSELSSNDHMDKLVNKFDQLKRAQRSGQAFMDYNEEKICFAPTYRLMVMFVHKLPLFFVQKKFKLHKTIRKVHRFWECA